MELYVTGAGVTQIVVSLLLEDRWFWTMAVKIIPLKKATRTMYKNNPGQFLLWYTKDLLSTEMLNQIKHKY